MGNSNSEYFIGPEVPYPTADPPEGYKDSSGAIKRQAARFRVYGYNKSNEVISELNSENADIEWTVHVANKKAAWYQVINGPERSLKLLTFQVVNYVTVTSWEREKITDN